MDSNIDIRLLLFQLPDLNPFLFVRRLPVSQQIGLPQIVVPLDDFNLSGIAQLQRAMIALLGYLGMLTMSSYLGADICGEKLDGYQFTGRILDTDDAVLKELAKVQPFVITVLQAAIVEVIAVDITDCLH